MRRLFTLILPAALAACAATGAGGPVLPGLVNAPPPPMAAEDTLPIGVVWSWQATRMTDGVVIVPEGHERYTLEFRPGGTVNVRWQADSEVVLTGIAEVVYQGEWLVSG